MNRIRHVIGATPYGVSRFLTTHHAAWLLAVAQQQRTVNDSDVNAMQQIVATHAAAFTLLLHRSGANIPLAPGTTTSGTIATIHTAPTMWVWLHGTPFPVTSATGTSTLVIDCGPGTASGKTQTVYLEVWYEEVQPTTASENASSTVYPDGNIARTPLVNDIQIAGVQGETARRIQRRYRLASAVVPDMTHVTPTGTATAYVASAAEPGWYRAGNGSVADAAALHAVDGYRYALALARVTQTGADDGIAAGHIVSLVPQLHLAADVDMVMARHASTAAIPYTIPVLNDSRQFAASIIDALQSGTAASAASVDGFNAAPSPIRNTLLALDANAKIANAALRMGHNGGIDVDSVDGVTRTALRALDANAKIANAALRTGSGGGLDADTVDGIGTSTLRPLDANAKIAAAALRMGHNGGIDADSVDGVTRTALRALDANAKIANAALRTGSGGGLDADSVDGIGTSTLRPLDSARRLPAAIVPNGTGSGLYATRIDGYAVTPSITPKPYHLMPLDGQAKIPSAVIRDGSGSGLTADRVDGLHAASIASAGHTHSAAAYRFTWISEKGTKQTHNASNQVTTITLPASPGTGLVFGYLVIIRPSSQAFYHRATVRVYVGSALVATQQSDATTNDITTCVAFSSSYSGSAQPLRGYVDWIGEFSAPYTFQWGGFAVAGLG